MEEEIEKIILEVRQEQSISPNISDQMLKNYVKEGIYDINDNCGMEIDYSKNLKARSLLKNYVLYANYNRLAEFKELYRGEYFALQAEYYKAASL